MNKHINFEIEDLKIIEEDSNSQFSTAKIQAFASGKNKHDMVCSEDVLKQTASTIYNKPILYTIDNLRDDFASHNDPDKTLIAGFVVPDSAEFSKLEDGRIGLNIFAKLWKRYAPKAIEIFKKSLKNKKVSVEMDLIDSEENDNGLINMKNFIYSGICLLGDAVSEASPGAHVEMLSFSDEQKDYQKAYTLEFGKYDDLDFTIPSKVKQNAKKGLDFYEKFGKGGNSVSLSTARFLMKNEKITLEKAKHIRKYMPKSSIDKIDEKNPDSFQITFLQWGGTEGYNWIKELGSQMDEIDTKISTYFENTITFPYKSLKDINPALGGIKPPISLGQANAIAAQADAIGTDEKKNGWAIAISQFKKTHTVEDGRWVKKGENMEDDTKKEEEEMAEKPKEETPEEEKKEQKKEGEDKKETPEEEKKEEKEEPKDEKMSLDANLDVPAILKMLEDETDNFKSVVEEEFAKPDGEKNFTKVVSAMYAKMCKMAEAAKTYLSEIDGLKKFKEDTEVREKQFEITSTMEALMAVADIPEDKKSEMEKKATEFSLENINGWKNYCKAVAFDYKKSEVEDKEDDGVKRYGLLWSHGKVVKKSCWDD